VNSTCESVSFPRRIAALLYDIVAVFTVLYFASFVPVLAAGGDAIAGGNPLFIIYLAVVAFGYFGVSWTRGRTLGMQAWKLEIESCPDRRRLTWTQAFIRFAAASLSIAMLGIGYFAALIDIENRTWHDRLSKSRLVPQRPRPERGYDSD
jgi:uncharacterized RDD family membrane protein YckC